jgi:actin-related protein
LKKDEIFTGLDALKRSPTLSLKYPIEHGIILDWEEITYFLDYIITKVA